MADGYDVIIVGAGVVGCSIARALARDGLTTLNVDVLPAAGYGSTSHSSAIVRPFYSHATACAVAHESRSRWLRWREFLDVEDARGFARYTECGAVVLVADGQERAFDANLAALDAVGVEHRWLDERKLRSIYPGISMHTYGPPRRPDQPGYGAPTGSRIVGAIEVPASGYVNDPQLAAHNLMSAAREAGAQFRFRSRVVAVECDAAGAVAGVRLQDGTRLACGRLINAAGPHSAQLNALAGFTDGLPMRTRAERHEVVYVPAPPALQGESAGVVLDLDGGTYMRPDGADVLVGSVDPPCDARAVVDPDAVDDQFSEQWTVQAQRAGQRFPDLGIPGTARGTVGLYDVSDDWIPIYDKTALPGYFVAIGTSGNQFKNAPVIGDLVLAVLRAEERGDHDRAPASLQLPAVGRSVDLSFYSRNRPVQHTSSVLA